VILTENKIFSLKIHCRGSAAKRLNHARIIESLLYKNFGHYFSPSDIYLKNNVLETVFRFRWICTQMSIIEKLVFVSEYVSGQHITKLVHQIESRCSYYQYGEGVHFKHKACLTSWGVIKWGICAKILSDCPILREDRGIEKIRMGRVQEWKK
jgi:hypothetical protein